MRSTIALLSVTCSLTAACIAKPPRAPGAEVVNFEISRDRLPNGVESIAERSPDTGTAGVVLVIRAGSRDERTEKAGVAHLTEHLVFERKGQTGTTLWRRLDEIGATTNASTSWDATTYFALVPVQRLPDLLALYAELVSDPLADVEPEDFEHERQIVRNEARSRAENGTQHQIVGWLAAATFPTSHPYAHPVVGTRQSLEALSLDDVRAFGASYANARVTLAVTAPLDTAATQGLVRKAFAGQTKRSHERGTTAPPSSAAAQGDGLAGMHEYRAPVPTPSVWIGWAVPGEYQPSADLAPLLVSMMHDALAQNVDERDTDIARVEAHFEAGVDAGLFYLEVTLNEGTDPEASARSALREIARGVAERMNVQQWRELYKRAVSVRHVYEEEAQISRVLNLANSAHFGDDPLFLRGRGRRLLAVERAELAEYLDQHLDPARARAIVVRPSAPGDRGASGPTGLATRRAGDAAGAPVPSPAELGLWMKPPGVAAAQTATLENGLSIIVLPRAGSPFHTLLLGFRGGSAHGAVRGAAAAAFWGRERQYGDITYPSTRGALARSEFAMDASFEIMKLTGSNVALSMELLEGVTTRYSTLWPTPQFTEQLALYTKEYQRPEAELVRRRRSALFGAHAYATWASPEELSRVRANQVYEWKDQMLRPENAVLIAVGDVSVDRALAAARAQFSDWHRSGGRQPPPTPPPALARAATSPETRILFEHRPQSTQAALFLSCVLPAAQPGNRASEALFERMLERLLFGQLREQSGSSYVVATSLQRLWGGSVVLDAFADVDYEKLADALLVLRRYLELPSATNLGQTLLDRSRANLASAHNLSYATTEQLARTLFEAWENGWPLASADRLPSQLLAATLGDVLTTSEHCRNNWVLSLLGDEARLRAGWSAALAKPLSAAGAPAAGIP